MLELLKQRLQRKQYKLTMQRRTVLEILLEHPGEHLSAEDVYGALRDKSSDVGLATVYRTLELLVQLGILQRMEFGDGCSRYEIADIEKNEHQHHHLICIKCGKVTEFFDDLLDELEADVAAKSGFKITDHQVKFYGYCKECPDELENK
ncbi:MAG: transcriptional repressor [Schwartzia sp.]|nr:transcriptional repressor [Schwartzia sp. (in: firmicutes)]